MARPARSRRGSAYTPRIRTSTRPPNSPAFSNVPDFAAFDAGRTTQETSRCSTRTDDAASGSSARQTQPGELPARLRRKEVAVGCADVRPRRCTRAAAKHVLVAHEL